MKIVSIISLILIACNAGRKSNPAESIEHDYFVAISKNDLKLAGPKPGEWLFDHPEKGQTFEAYKRANLQRPTQNKSVIYVMPVGNFNGLQQKALQLTREYIEIMYEAASCDAH